MARQGAAGSPMRGLALPGSSETRLALTGVADLSGGGNGMAWNGWTLREPGWRVLACPVSLGSRLARQCVAGLCGGPVGWALRCLV